MLHIDCSFINENFIFSKCLELKRIKKLECNFYSGKRYLFDGVEFSLLQHRNREKGVPPKWKWQIQINPKDFSSLSKMELYLKKMIGESDHQIKRLDFSSLLLASFFCIQDLFESLNIAGKKRSECYTNTFKSENAFGKKVSLTYGARPHRLSIYLRDKCGKPIKKHSQAHFINIEIQCSDKKRLLDMGVSKIKDIRLLKHKKCFKGLHFYDIYNPQNVSLRKKAKIKKIIDDSRIDGFHSARKSNSAGHFDDRYLIHFHKLRVGIEKKTLAHVIKKSFRRGFREWLNR